MTAKTQPDKIRSNMKRIIMLACVAALCVHTQSAPSSHDCLTASNDVGTCVPVDKCEGVLKIIKSLPYRSGAIGKLTSQQDKQLQYVRDSRCKGESEYSVCCAHANDQNCGMFPESRIIRGNTSYIDEHPWLVMVGYGGEENPRELVCGGSLISAKHVLTAASCLRVGQTATVRLGEYDTTKDRDCVEFAQGDLDCADPVVDIVAAKVTLHPRYDTASGTHDLALITLENSVNYTDFIRPICLPENDLASSDKPLFGAGWNLRNSTSYTAKIQGSMSQVPLDECERTFGLKGLGDDQVCAKGSLYYGSNTIDYGGPLTAYGHQQRHELMAVAGAFKKDLKEAGDILIFERVRSNIDWIKSAMLE